MLLLSIVQGLLVNYREICLVEIFKKVEGYDVVIDIYYEM